MARTRTWLWTHHPWRVEVVAVVTLYAVYEATRGLAAGGASVAVRHAHVVASWERTIGVFVEHDVQAAAHTVPGLLGMLSVSYLTLHLGVTAAYLVWLYRRDPIAFPLARTTLLIATALSVAIFVLYPTAPPRMAGVGIADTVSGNHVDLNRGLLHAFYNPFAAIPSLHFGYALVVGTGLYRHGQRWATRITGVLYPLLVLGVIVATGNHFLIDAAAGAAIVALALVAAVGLRPHRGEDRSPQRRRDRMVARRCTTTVRVPPGNVAPMRSTPRDRPQPDRAVARARRRPGASAGWRRDR